MGQPRGTGATRTCPARRARGRSDAKRVGIPPGGRGRKPQRLSGLMSRSRARNPAGVGSTRPGDRGVRPRDQGRGSPEGKRRPRTAQPREARKGLASEARRRREAGPRNGRTGLVGEPLPLSGPRNRTPTSGVRRSWPPGRGAHAVRPRGVSSPSDVTGGPERGANSGTPAAGGPVARGPAACRPGVTPQGERAASRSRRRRAAGLQGSGPAVRPTRVVPGGSTATKAATSEARSRARRPARGKIPLAGSRDGRGVRGPPGAAGRRRARPPGGAAMAHGRDASRFEREARSRYLHILGTHNGGKRGP